MIESIGQLLITGIEGLSLSDEEKKFIADENIGGVILFAKNYKTPEQLGELINSIQTYRQEDPFFISVDHEGGRVMRFRDHFTQFPSMSQVAQTQSPKLCYETHKIMAEELVACGINLSYSPVCDILTLPQNQVIGDRSFGQDAELVSKYATAAIRGLQANGVLACAKHFPGHGGTLLDSHFDLPVVKTLYEGLLKNEFIPFIRASKSRTEFMMMGHLLAEDLDKDLPCSLSPRAYEIIRRDLKFTKIIITDDMEMKALTDKFPVEKIAAQALSAGADMLIYRTFGEARKALHSVKESFRTKELKKVDMEAKLERVNSCKKKYLNEYRPIYIPSISSKLNSKQSQNFLSQLLDQIRSPRPIDSSAS